jgi:hypothetical protein
LHKIPDNFCFEMTKSTFLIYGLILKFTLIFSRFPHAQSVYGSFLLCQLAHIMALCYISGCSSTVLPLPWTDKNGVLACKLILFPIISNSFYFQDIHAYNCGFYENLRQALGSRWPLIFISPFLPSPLPSDGISFKAFELADISKETKYL